MGGVSPAAGAGVEHGLALVGRAHLARVVPHPLVPAPGAAPFHLAPKLPLFTPKTPLIRPKKKKKSGVCTQKIPGFSPPKTRVLHPKIPAFGPKKFQCLAPKFQCYPPRNSQNFSAIPPPKFQRLLPKKFQLSTPKNSSVIPQNSCGPPPENPQNSSVPHQKLPNFRHFLPQKSHFFFPPPKEFSGFPPFLWDFGGPLPPHRGPLQGGGGAPAPPPPGLQGVELEAAPDGAALEIWGKNGKFGHFREFWGVRGISGGNLGVFEGVSGNFGQSCPRDPREKWEFRGYLGIWGIFWGGFGDV